MKKKSAVIGSSVIVMMFTFAMESVGVNALANTNGVAISSVALSQPAVLTTSSSAGQSSSTNQNTLSSFVHHHDDNDRNDFGVNQ